MFIQYWFKCFLIALVLCHGLFDFYEANGLSIPSPMFNISYQLCILLYIVLLLSEPIHYMIWFILLTMYHFGEDYRYLLGGSYITRLFGAIIIGATSLNIKGELEWKKLITSTYSINTSRNMSVKTDLRYQAVYATIFMLKSISIMSLIWYNWYSELGWLSRLLSVLLFIICSQSVPSSIEVIHLILFHVPIAAYRIWSAYGWSPILLWLCASIMVTHIIIAVEHHGWRYNTIIGKYGEYGNIGRIALTIPHIIVTTLWQLWCV